MAGDDLSRARGRGHVAERGGRVASLSFRRSLRSPHPKEVRIAIVLDKVGPDRLSLKDPRVGQRAKDTNVELAHVPLHGSWRNRIEAQVTALRDFALHGTDHTSHAEQVSMIRRYIA